MSHMFLYHNDVMHKKYNTLDYHANFLVLFVAKRKSRLDCIGNKDVTYSTTIQANTVFACNQRLGITCY